MSLSRATPCQDTCPVPLPTPAQLPCMHPDPDDSHPWRSRARSWRTGVCSALCLPPGTRSEKAGLSRHPQVGVEEEAPGYIKASAGARWTAGRRANQSACPCGGGAPQPPPRTEEPEAPASGHTAAAELASPARPEGSQLLGAHPSPPSSSASLAASKGMGANFGLYLLLPSSHTAPEVSPSLALLRAGGLRWTDPQNGGPVRPRTIISWGWLFQELCLGPWDRGSRVKNVPLSPKWHPTHGLLVTSYLFQARKQVLLSPSTCWPAGHGPPEHAPS